jgi:FkbM family methyltransferase
MFKNWIDTFRVWRHLTPYQRQLLAALGPHDIAIDCGANVGLVSRYLARGGATVYAFEPNPHAFAVLKKNCASIENIKPIAAAVGMNDSTERLYLHEQAGEGQVEFSQGSSMIRSKTNVNPDTFIEVQTIDLAGFIKNLGHKIRVLKMDIEGYEVDVIPHLITSGAIDHVDHVFVETHADKAPDLKTRTDAMRDLISSRGLQNKIMLDWY